MNVGEAADYYEAALYPGGMALPCGVAAGGTIGAVVGAKIGAGLGIAGAIAGTLPVALVLGAAGAVTAAALHSRKRKKNGPPTA